jgi:5-oxoprolinase (ATP-hydrolysing) subunit C
LTRVKAHLKVMQSAPRMHFQDLGRYGYGHTGLSQGGAIDLHAHCWANFLLENDPASVTIEISIGNTTLLALDDAVIAITGAVMNARIDGELIQNWSSHLIRKGQTLKLGYAAKGMHSYLGIKGGFSAEQKLGSASTVVRNNIGENLTGGKLLESNAQEMCDAFIPRKTPSHFIPDYDAVREIRMMVSPKLDDLFIEKFSDTGFSISPKSDRMGMNLTADNPLPRLDGIISEGIALGSVQLPPNGHPIVLLNDRQTQGGYAKIGNIVRVDLPLLVQAKPLTKIKLTPVSVEEAAREWAEFVRFFGL